MNRSRFLAIASILGLVFGLAFLLAPAQLMSFYGITLDAAGQWIGRFLGAQLVGLATITWLARNAPTGGALSAVMLGNLVGAVIALVLALLQGSQASAMRCCGQHPLSMPSWRRALVTSSLPNHSRTPTDNSARGNIMASFVLVHGGWAGGWHWR